MDSTKMLAKALCGVVLACALSLPAAGLAWAAQDGAFDLATTTIAAGDVRAESDVWDGTADVSWYSASAKSFTITTAEQLAGLARIVNGTADGIAQDSFIGKTVALGSDIVLNPVGATSRDTTGAQKSWTPIGDLVLTGFSEGAEGAMPHFDDPYYFDGTFDGNGHVVKNLYIYNNVSGTYGGVQALFANVGGHAVIRNLGIEGGYVYGRVAAGIAAISHATETDYPRFIGCYNSATIEGNGSTTRGAAGIFAGEEQYRSEDNYHGGAYIANCYNVGTIKRAQGGSPSAGGIAGTGSIQIYGCHNYGDVEIPSAYAGALAGNLVGSTYRVGQGTETAFYGASVVRDSYAVADCVPADDQGIVKLYNYLDADHVKGGRGDENPAIVDSATAKFKDAAWFAGDDAAGALSMSYAKGDAIPVLYWQAGLMQLALNDTDDQGVSRGAIRDIPSQAYTGSPLRPAVNVVYNTGTYQEPRDIELHEGSDYLVAYDNNVEVGTADVTVSGIGRFLEEKPAQLVASFKIYNGDLATATIQPITAQWYYGEPVEPDVVVLASNGDQLKQGVDYALSFSGNVNPEFDDAGKAEASVTIEPVEGNAVFTGSKTLSFTILQASNALDTDAEGAYLIKSKADLQYLAWKTSTAEGSASFDGATFKLAGDVDATSTDDAYMTDRPCDPLFTYWSPTEGGFSGTFDGQGHAITLGMTQAGLSIDPDLPLALFMYTKRGATSTFKDLTIKGSVKSPNAQAAGLLIMAQSGTVTIENVTNKASITGNKSVYGSAAGLVVETCQKSAVDGSAGVQLLVNNCKNEGTISSVARAAGLIGALGADTAVLTNCTNTGAVTGGGQGAGGLVALVLGDDKADNRVAKISFVDCQNKGKVMTKRVGDAGGLVGWNQEYVESISFNRCANTGEVSYNGDGCVGAGIIGRAYSPVHVSNSYNNAAIISNGTSNRPGGIIGYAAPEPKGSNDYDTDTFKNVYSTGSFGTCAQDAGGIVGIVWLSSKLEFDNVYYDSGVSERGIGYNCADGWPNAINPPIYVGEPIAQDETVMKTPTFATMLGSAFVADSDGENGGYPVISSEAHASRDLTEGYKVTADTPDTFQYTGAPIKFDVFGVTDDAGTNELEEGKDYVVFYATDGLAGRAIVQGIGDYTGSFTHEFAISKCMLAACSVSQVSSLTYSDCAGGAAVQSLELKSPSGARMIEGVDYEVMYANNTVPGVAYLRIEGKGYYTGALMRMFAIEKGDLSTIEVEGIEAHYPMTNGSGGLYVYEQLRANSGYVLERADTPSEQGDYARFFYDENGDLVTTESGAAASRIMKAGAYTVVLKAEAVDRNGTSWTNGYWTGETSASFTYGNRMDEDAAVEGISEVYCFTGSDIEMAPTVTSKVTGYALTEGADYEMTLTTKDGNPVDAVRDTGEYKAVIAGKGAWFGTCEIVFTVQPKEFYIGDDTAVIGVESTYAYTGEGVTPAPSSVKVGEKVLYRDVEYTVSYEDASGTPVAEPKEMGSYQIVVTGMGSYRGTTRIPFEIAESTAGDTDSPDSPGQAGASGQAKPATPTALKANTLKVKGKTVTVKKAKKAKKVKAAKAYKIVGAQGKLTFAKVGKSKLKVSKKTGAIKVPKKLKRGTYTVKVRVRASGGNGYLPASKTVKVKVKVKIKRSAR